jgi:hypothetical protein
VHLRTLLVVAALALLLSGCADPKADADPATQVPDASMSIVGLVQDEAFAAVPGAEVQLRLVDRSTTTDAAGNFRFDGLVPSAYLVDVRAGGYETATLTAEPTTALNASLNFILARPLSLRPSVEVVHFKGILQCAAEALIISGSCDNVLTAADQGQLFEDTSTFQLALRPRWHSIVVDVDFDPGTAPGVDGLRLVMRGIDDSDQLNDYQQYGRFHDVAPYTARMDVNGTYDDGVGAVPANLTAIEFVVYPQGYAWHEGCAGETCFAGVGGGTDVEFDLYVTVFYNQLAPEGYTLRSA